MTLYTPSPSTCAVSVVIPMFNAEKYIGALLESLLAQTFTNFEVIIVDDCSTDSSCAIVESYAEKFNGRLKLSRMKTNSGNPGAPTNRGIGLAVGKYIYQLDNDDMLTNGAIKELYNAAEHFNVEVVQTDRYIFFNDDPKKPVPSPESLLVSKGIIDKAAFLPNDINERMKIFCNNFVRVMGWLKFVRRDFLVENRITFQEDVPASQDIIWTIELLFYAKRYLLIPQPLYVYRQRANSVSHCPRRGADSIKYRGHLLVKGADYLCRFFARHKFFQENPQCAYLLLDWLERRYYRGFTNAFQTVPPPQAQRVLEKFFAAEFGEHCGLVSYLCTSVNVSRLNQNLLTRRVNELEQKLKQLTDAAK